MAKLISGAWPKIAREVSLRRTPPTEPVRERTRAAARGASAEFQMLEQAVDKINRIPRRASANERQLDEAIDETIPERSDLLLERGRAI